MNLGSLPTQTQSSTVVPGNPAGKDSEVASRLRQREFGGYGPEQAFVTSSCVCLYTLKFNL